MFTAKTILIVEDNSYSAYNLASAIEQHNGTVAGPYSNTQDTMAVIGGMTLNAAIVDGDVPDLAALAAVLDHADVPIVFQLHPHSPPLAAVCKDPPNILYRPVDTSVVVSMVALAIDRLDQARR